MYRPILTDVEAPLQDAMSEQTMKRFKSRDVRLTDGRQGQSSAPIALSMALLISAGLFIRSLANVSRVDLGIKVDRLVTFAISPSLNGYQPARSAALFNRTVEELQALPGVSAVTSARVAVLTRR